MRAKNRSNELGNRAITFNFFFRQSSLLRGSAIIVIEKLFATTFSRLIMRGALEFNSLNKYFGDETFCDANNSQLGR
jgi:hypothetical protein